MTNGEKLQSIFPNMEWEVKDNTVLTDVDNGSWFSLDWWNAEYKEPNKSENPTDSTTKNNLAQERYQDLINHFGDETVAKTILGNRKEFTAWLERLRWNVKRVDELAKELEQMKGTTKNDLGVDAVSREAVHDMLENLPITVEDKWFNWLQKACMRLAELPPVTPQDIDYKAQYESFTKKSEIVISQLRADRDRLADCLDKIRVEIDNALSDGMIHKKTVLGIIDKYKGESEE